MANETLQTRSMRKAVERVDVGVFGAPMRLANWLRRRKSTWGGWAAVTACQGLVGGLIALLAGMALGVASNALSWTVLVGFVAGSAIGGPFSFTLWTVLLLGVTGLVAGLWKGAWVSSPSWWRVLAAGWEQGQVVPPWFMIGVPVWLLFWVAAARGVSKVTETMFEKIALRLGFRAASRYSGEDKMLYEEAFEQSDVSPAESRSLLESSGDGTGTLVAVEGSRIAPRQAPVQGAEMGGDPDVSGVPLPEASDDIDYASVLGTPEGEPVRPAPAPTPSPAVEAEAAPPTATVSVPVEMDHPDLPAVPTDTAPPVQRIESPRVDPRANRALNRRMSQLNLAFQTARREDRDVEFVEKHQAELAKISDEQRAILETMKDTGPLLALIHEIQVKRTEDFIVGRVQPDVAPGTGSLEGVAEDADQQPERTADEAVAEVAQPDVDETSASSSVEEADAPVARTDRASAIDEMAASFASLLGPRRRTVVEAVEAVAGSTSDAEAAASASPDGEVATSDDLLVEAGVLPHAVTTTVAEETTIVSPATDAVPETGPSEVSATGQSVEPPELAPKAVSPVATPMTPESIAASVAARRAATASSHAAEPASPQPDAAPGDAGEPDGTFGGFVVALVPKEAKAEDAGPEGASDGVVEGVGAGASSEDEAEEEMSNREFSRVVCRQVLGLVSGSVEPAVKADDVMSFEASNPDTRVAEVINSRSFNEHVGERDAADARHAWREVRKILSKSTLERLTTDMERMNARGHAMIGEPHTLTDAAYHSFDTDSSRLRTIAMQTDLNAMSELITENVAILDTLRSIHESRAEASRTRAGSAPGGVVRQKVMSERDDAASRGRGLIGSVLKGARSSGVGVMREGPERGATPPADVEQHMGNDVVDLADAGGIVSEATAAGAEANAGSPVAPAPPAAKVAQLGDDDYVSPHPAGSAEHARDMSIHEGARRARLEFEAQQRTREEEERERAATQEREERDRRDQAERDRVEREAGEQAERDRQAEDERRRRTEEDERERERRTADERREADQREAIAREQREAAEAERRAREAEAERASLQLARERARSEEEQLIIRQYRERQKELEVPERLRSEDVISSVMALAEMRNTRLRFQGTTAGQRRDDMSDVEAAIRIPSFRGMLQVDVEMARVASAVIARVATALEATDPDDMDHLRGLLDTDEERKFVGSMISNVDRGRASGAVLGRADENYVEVRRRAESAGEAEALRTALEARDRDASDARGRAEEAQREADALRGRVETAERERAEAVDRLETLRREQAGVVDDDFQQVLEKHGRSLQHLTGGIDGFFAFDSHDKMSTVVVMTLPASAAPEGALRRGTRSVPVLDFVERLAARASDVDAENVAVIFTDPQMRAYTSGSENVVVKQVRRSVDELKSVLGDYGIQIGEGE